MVAAVDQKSMMQNGPLEDELGALWSLGEGRAIKWLSVEEPFRNQCHGGLWEQGMSSSKPRPRRI